MVLAKIIITVVIFVKTFSEISGLSPICNVFNYRNKQKMCYRNSIPHIF